MSAQAHVRESESSSGSFISPAVPCLAGDVRYRCCCRDEPEHAFNFSRLMGGSVNLNKQFSGF